MMEDNRMIDTAAGVTTVSDSSPEDQGVGENSCNSNVPTPLSATMLDEMESTGNTATSTVYQTQRQHSASPLSFEAAAASSNAGRFRRHSSQSASLINIPLNLSLSSSYAANTATSGPISSGCGMSNGLMSPLNVTSSSTGLASNGTNTERVCSVIYIYFF